MQADNDADNDAGTPEPPGGPDDDTAFRRLIVQCLLAIAVCLVALGLIGRTAYYGLHPERRPQPAASAGSVETCDHACTQRRLNEAEQRLRELETPR